MAELDFAADAAPNAREMALGGEVRFDGRAAGRQLVENGDVEVAVERERESARDGRCGENKHVRGVAVGGGFVHETLALQHAEAVLFVDGHEAEACKLHAFFDQGVCADDELGFAGGDAFDGR